MLSKEVNLKTEVPVVGLYSDVQVMGTGSEGYISGAPPTRRRAGTQPRRWFRERRVAPTFIFFLDWAKSTLEQAADNSYSRKFS